MKKLLQEGSRKTTWQPRFLGPLTLEQFIFSLNVGLHYYAKSLVKAPLSVYSNLSFLSRFYSFDLNPVDNVDSS